MITKIKVDSKGLFVRCDGYIARNALTKFKTGNSVSATHPAGPSIYVKSKPNRKEKPEIWDIDSEASYELQIKMGLK